MEREKGDDIIRSKIRSLDQTPLNLSWEADDLWEQIQSGGLSGARRKRKRLYWISGLAASISLFLVVFLMTQYRSDQLAYDIEYVEEGDQVSSGQINQEEEMALHLIKESCQNGLPVCKTEEFKQLSMELDALESELNELKQMALVYGDDPVFVKSEIQIENQKSEITFQLVQLILS